jgi:FkbM family methyltransferase
MNYYSQFEQDKFVYENYFSNKTEGYFVDIGAADGIKFSNSKFFEELGWKGVCAEPNPKAFNSLQKCRINKCVMKAISDKVGTEKFFQITGGPEQLSGLVEEFPQSAIARINNCSLEDKDFNFDYIEVECDLFENIVDQNQIDFLSLDTEGNELKILQTIDFNKFDINVITVENNDYDDKFVKFLISKGYSFITRLGCDELYKKQ